MAYESTYDAVYDLHDDEAAWDETVEVGSREALNVAVESIGRHGDSAETAVRIRDFEADTTDAYTYADLNDGADRFAAYLQDVTDRADRVAAMLPARFELYATIFGTIKAGRIYVPLAPLFGPDALNYRLADSGTAVLVTTEAHADKLDRDATDVERLVMVDGAGDGGGVEPWGRIADTPPIDAAVRTHPDDIHTLKYTSGTTGQPKGVPTRHRRMVHGSGYGDYVIDLRPSDNYFVAASPAWSYGLGATISAGITDSGIDTYRGEFDPESFVETLEAFETTNLMAPPTALRQVRSADVDPADYDVDVRILLSAGEALDEDTVRWCRETFGAPPLDAYGQTEAGMLLCNYAFDDWEIKPGSAGKPLPGMSVDLFEPDGDDPVADGEVGEIVVHRDDVSAGGDRLYWGDPQKTVETYQGQWYRTGDLARRDEDGYYWYVSRKDEVIISAGYRIGPEEVQETLMKHEAVAEVGVAGVPDETRGQLVKAFVELGDGADATDALREDIRGFARSRLSKHEYPREIEFVDALPKTSSGKIKRTELGAE